jgi:hypothetical protein
MAGKTKLQYGLSVVYENFFKHFIVNELPSLDKELYNGLITLKDYNGNVEQDFCLNFTIVDNGDEGVIA